MTTFRSVNILHKLVKIFLEWQTDGTGRTDGFAAGALHNTVVGVGNGHFCPFDSFGLTEAEDSRFAEILTVAAAVAECGVEFRKPGDLFAGEKKPSFFWVCSRCIPCLPAFNHQGNHKGVRPYTIFNRATTRGSPVHRFNRGNHKGLPLQ